MLSTVPGTPTGPEPAPNLSSDRPLLLASLRDGPRVRSRYAEWGVEPIYEMGGALIDPGHSGRWTIREKTDKWIDDNVPRTAPGYLCLDWEGGAFEVLQKGPSDPNHAAVMAEMIRLVRHVKGKRPLMKVGYYGLPLREYWKQGEEWRSNTRALAPLFDACDVLFPSVYDFYADEDAAARQRDHQRFGAIVRLALEMAKGKPVLLYCYHRYHNSTERWGGRLIPEEELIAHVKHLMAVEHEGRRPVGVVAWGAEAYYYRESFARKPDRSFKHTGADWERRRAAFTQEKERGLAPGEYHDSVNSHVLSVYARALDR